MNKSEMFKLAHKLTREVIERSATAMSYQSVFAIQLKRVQAFAAKQEQHADEVTTIVKCLDKVGFDGDVEAYLYGLFRCDALSSRQDVLGEVLFDIEGALVYVNKDTQSFYLKRALLGRPWVSHIPQLQKYYFNEPHQYDGYSYGGR